MATLQNSQPRERLECSWYDLVADQLETLIPRFGLEQASTQLYRSYELICSESLGLRPGEQSTRSSRLNRDGTPIQYALTLGQGATPLRFVSETGDPGLSYADTREFITRRVRTLSAVLRMQGNWDSVADMIGRASEVNVHRADPGTFWMGASFAADGKPELKIYVYGKNDAEHDQWARVEDFAAYIGALEKLRNLRRLLAGQMTPLGVAISLTQDEPATGQVYLSGYGNRVSYYEYLLRHCGGEHCVGAFRRYTEVVLGEDRAYPTQSVVFSVGLGLSPNGRADVEIEFCGHCLFESDRQARDRCERWLALRKIDPHAYASLLEVVAGQMSPTEVNTHINFGLGWKHQHEYTTVSLKPHPGYVSAPAEE